MIFDVKELYKRAMSLDAEERAELAGMLLDSLEIDAEGGVEPAWLTEIEKRLEAIDTGVVETVPWSEVRSRVFAARAR